MIVMQQEMSHPARCDRIAERGRQRPAGRHPPRRHLREQLPQSPRNVGKSFRERERRIAHTVPNEQEKEQEKDWEEE